MPIKLSIEMISPLTPDDRDLLAGIAVMTVAIANREINQNSVEVEPEPPVEATCGQLEYIPYNDEGPMATGKVCVREPHTNGRHRFRHPPVAQALVN